MDAIGDDAVAATNDYAAICKYQAVSLGYYRDEHLRYFLSTKVLNSSQKKAPEILRGYYARSAAIAYIVERFISTHPDAQILSLGAGYDSLFWRLRTRDLIESSRFRYVEIDMANVTLHKVMAIRRHSALTKELGNIRCKGDGLHSDLYHLLTFDLRQVDKSSLLRKLKDDCDLDFKRPTLCVTECVLVFMPLENSTSLIRWLKENFESLSFTNYEQCNITDRFGSIMMSSLSAQHCDLMGAAACASLDTQKKRFTSNGFKHIKAWTLSDIYKNLLATEEKDRIESLEFLDEGELLDQLLDHYCLVIASNSGLDWIPDGHWEAATCAPD